jgi:starch synthase (maltosyl-transferring)
MQEDAAGAIELHLASCRETLRTVPLPTTSKPPSRIQVQDVAPQVDCGRSPVKRTVGDSFEVTATIFRDGHEVLGAAVRYKPPGATRWREARMEPLPNDRWAGSFDVDACGRWSYRIEAWVDRVASFQDELQRKVAAGQEDLAGELSEGAVLLGRDELTVEEALAARAGERSGKTVSPTYEVDVDRELARFGAWYELFPRSWGGFDGVRRVLPRLAELGFDVVYLPPVHPIGETNRKGRNNALVARRGDPGSPWAIGSSLGGHTAIDPNLGTLADFDRLVESASELGMDVALDFAIQCSPDHPWLREHPEWFHHRPDGTLKYAENPPKRYQDIYNVNFDSEDWRGLWEALRDVVLFWVGHGVKVFRVDNPHTKPIAFWRWLIDEVRKPHPEVVFLSEAFTRPSLVTALAKAGFSQSYTYFTWKNTRWELLELMGQLLDWAPYHRPNFFANTPDILHEYLQLGGQPAFEARLVLAATLSPSYGIYSGFERLENVPVREGSEEYLDSEKYEVKKRRLDGPLLPLIRKLNRARRENPALQRLENVTFLETENERLFAYLKRTGSNVVIACVNLDPVTPQEGLAIVPAASGLPPAFSVVDLLGRETFTWHVGRNYVALPPGQSHLMRAGA